jgi:hypothetical protein
MRISDPRNEFMNAAIFQLLTEEVQNLNHYCEIFHPASDVLNEQQILERFDIRFNREYVDPDIHEGRQNAPSTTGQVAAVHNCLPDEDGVLPFERDMRVFERSDAAQLNPSGQRRNIYFNPIKPFRSSYVHSALPLRNIWIFSLFEMSSIRLKYSTLSSFP